MCYPLVSLAILLYCAYIGRSSDDRQSFMICIKLFRFLWSQFFAHSSFSYCYYYYCFNCIGKRYPSLFFRWIPSDSEVFRFIKSFRNAKKSNKQSHKIHNQINTHTHQIQFELRASELFVHIINRYVIAIYAWLFVRFRSLSLSLSLSRSHLHQNKCWSSASFSIIASMSAAKVIPK